MQKQLKIAKRDSKVTAKKLSQEAKKRGKVEQKKDIKQKKIRKMQS